MVTPSRSIEHPPKIYSHPLRTKRKREKIKRGLKNWFSHSKTTGEVEILNKTNQNR